MTITSKQLTGNEAFTGVARTEHDNAMREKEKLIAELEEVKAKVDAKSKKKSKQKKK
tara:strand:- start:39797 stop:39967 length:171 start_codon:yes stop_codon:yes gene_type:complete